MKVPQNKVDKIFPFLGKKLVFIHTPKCGGTFINRAFGRRFKRCPTMVWPEARGHKTYAEYRDIFSSRGQDIHENFLFSIVRNPFSWHVSWYRYIQGDPGGLHSGHKIESKLFKKMKFSDYVEWLQDPDAPRSPQGYIQRQIHEWLTDERGVIRVDCVLRQERLELDFQDLIRRTGILVSVGGDRENVSNFGEWRNYYTSQEVEERLNKVFGFADVAA